MKLCVSYNQTKYTGSKNPGRIPSCISVQIASESRSCCERNRYNNAVPYGGETLKELDDLVDKVSVNTILTILAMKVLEQDGNILDAELSAINNETGEVHSIHILAVERRVEHRGN